jgi:hypothetical protein
MQSEFVAEVSAQRVLMRENAAAAEGDMSAAPGQMLAASEEETQGYLTYTLLCVGSAVLCVSDGEWVGPLAPMADLGRSDAGVTARVTGAHGSALRLLVDQGYGAAWPMWDAGEVVRVRGVIVIE